MKVLLIPINQWEQVWQELFLYIQELKFDGVTKGKITYKANEIKNKMESSA